MFIITFCPLACPTYVSILAIRGSYFLNYLYVTVGINYVQKDNDIIRITSSLQSMCKI